MEFRVEEPPVPWILQLENRSRVVVQNNVSTFVQKRDWYTIKS